MNRVTLAILLTILLLVGAVFVAITLARGYSFNLDTRNLIPTGILVATSDPDGAEVLIDGKLKTATNNTINLSPGKYDIKIQKDGFTPWEKKVEVKKEEVFKTNVFLFPRVPDLRPLTLTGALNPAVSPDGTKMVYSVASASGEKNGVWLIDMGQSFIPAPIPSPGAFRLLFRDTPSLNLDEASFQIGPDNRQVIASLESNGASSSGTQYILLTDRINDQIIPATQTEIDDLLTSWDQTNQTQLATQMARLDPKLETVLATMTANVKFAPDQSKLLYQATSSATIPIVMTTYLPGKDPTPEVRELKAGNWYVYDLKEDKNYLITKTGSISWFPSSRHLLEFTASEIDVMEYDGTNKATVYAGPFVDGLVTPWPNWSKIVILTSLNGVTGTSENLYTINLR